MTLALKYLLLLACILVLPWISLGIVRKVKARLQFRVGPPLFQVLFDLLRLFRKAQTVSTTTSWIFLASCAINTSVILVVACLVPWLSFKPGFPGGGEDLFLVLYLLASVRFMTILSALDPGSSFGAFGASREAYLSMLVEPAIFISLAALGLLAHSSNLSVIFAFLRPAAIEEVPVWLAVAVGLFLASVVDLSRMPVDDPTTHLELTMVHEAMILENSGKNLALVEYCHLLRMVVLYGLATQCVLHAASYACHFSQLLSGILSVIGILLFALLTGLLESVAVKLQWRKTPEFIAYALTMGLFATAAALIGGIYVRHGL